MLEDYYSLLGIESNADSKAIQKAFHRLAKQYHPDKNPGDKLAAEQFKKISEAYITLSDPAKKSQYDLKLRYGAYADYLTSVQRQRFRRRTSPVSRHFYRKHVTFSPQVRIMGGLSIAAIILVVAITTIFLTRYNAQYDFQRGLANYHNQRYSAAFFNLKESISPLNPYLAAAHLLMAEITFNQQRNLELTRDHIKKAYMAEASDSIKARLLFLEGKVDYAQGSNESAYQRFFQAASLLPKFDSATYQMGELDLFVFARFDRALVHFQTPARNNPNNNEAILASAYCYQKLNEHENAIAQIDQFLMKRKNVGMAHYIKAISARALDLDELSCENFLEAYRLNVPAALDSLNSYCGMSFSP
jgi:tetratricopeptide (TPR) repeat protein